MNNPGVLFFALHLYEEDYRRRFMRLKRRAMRDRHNPFEIPDIEFMSTFRLNKPLVQEILETISVHAERSQRRTRIPFHLRVLVTLNFFGGGSYQRRTAGHILTYMGQSTVSRSISEVSQLITRYMMPNKIKFPTTNEKRNSIKEGFYEKWEIRGVIGAVDGTHVEIIAPPEIDVDHPPFIYINRKGRHSINVMLICDSDNLILAVNARYPGSAHDAAV